MNESTGFYPIPVLDTAGNGVVSRAGSVLLTDTARKLGLDREFSAVFEPWRRPMAIHGPGKIVLDLAITLAIGGDCLADIGQLRAEPSVFGHVASDPTVSRLIATLTGDASRALAAIHTARAAARDRAWTMTGADAPGHGCGPDDPMIIGLDAT